MKNTHVKYKLVLLLPLTVLLPSCVGYKNSIASNQSQNTIDHNSVYVQRGDTLLIQSSRAYRMYNYR